MKKQIKFLNKIFNKPITCLTAYSASIAKLLDGNIDIILVGDSLGSTLYGMKNTRDVTINMMKLHGKVVTENVKKSIVVIDMPYKSYINPVVAFKNAKKLINFTKANVLKLEVQEKTIPIIKYLSKKKLNVIAHIGVTPQSFIDFKKIKVVGKNDREKKQLLELAVNAELAGAQAILLECVTEKLSKEITASVSIPTIGIGSSKYCDGQVLVFDDLVNINDQKKLPRFVKTYINFGKETKKILKKFSKEVKSKKFPSRKYTYQ